MTASRARRCSSAYLALAAETDEADGGGGTLIWLPGTGTGVIPSDIIVKYL